MESNEVQRLEEISDFYAQGDYMDELLVDREAELIRRLALSSSNALEVGCGNGYSTQKLLGLFENYEVLEPSSKNINLMKDRDGLKDVTCYNKLLEDFSSEYRFDNIIFLNVIEHVKDPIALLKILAGLLTDEGRIYLSAPNCMSLNRRAGYKMGLLKEYSTLAPKDYVLGHRRLYTVDMMREHCLAAGLKVIEMKGIYLKPLSEQQMVNLGDSVVRAFYSLGEDIPEYCANIFAVAMKNYY
jgi:2-polyprenyl-3-methyl-5-hydroxy-6-metoxy-1,4-benzoquinol methylase